jgi:hypothetical protein
MIFDFVLRFLEEDGFVVQPVAGRTALQFGFQTPDFRWRCVADVREEQGVLTYLSFVPEPVLAARRVAVAELLMRINYTLAVGNFELDFDDGECRFRTSIDLEGTDPTRPLVRQLLRANLASMGRYLEAIERAAAG